MTETQDNGTSVPLDRARGVMVGLAVGNLFGIVHEGWSRQSIAHRYPDGIREIMAKPGYPDDDDIAQAIALAEAAAEGPLDLDDVGRRFWDWAEINGAGMGGADWAGTVPVRRKLSPAADAQPAHRAGSRTHWHVYRGGFTNCLGEFETPR